jgi:DNA-binding transcriptional LysR family regulator
MPNETPDDLHLRALRVFVTLAECRVMSVAGSRLGLSQARVSQSIRSLEDKFGTELFSRDRRPLDLTRSGHILYEKALQMLELEDEIWASVRTMSAQKRPILHMAGATSFVDVIGGSLIPVVSSLAEQWRITAGLTPDHVEMFLSRQVDMIVTVDEMLEQQSGLKRYELMREPYVLAVPATFGETPDIAELVRSLPLIRYGRSGGSGRQMIRHLARMNLEPIQTIEIESVFAQMTLVSRGQGWGLTTPLCFASTPSFHASVRLEPITRGSFRRQLSLITRDREDDTAADLVAEASRDILKAEAFQKMSGDYNWLEGQFTFF